MKKCMKCMKILIRYLSTSPFFWLRSRAILNDKGNKLQAAKKKKAALEFYINKRVFNLESVPN